VAEREFHCLAGRTADGTRFPGFVELRLIGVRLAMGPGAPGLPAGAGTEKKVDGR
jgi:hypothetical protein